MSSDEFWEKTPAAASLRAAAADLREIEAPARVETRLLEAFRRENGIPAPRGMRRRWVPALTWLSAAATVAALALFLVRGHDPDRRNTPPPSRTPQSAVQWAGARLPAVVLEQVAADAGSDFVTLPNATEIGPNDEVNIVRLEVPRDRLLVLGFVVNADRVSGTVEADVMLGPDGLAHAVRFVE